MSKLIDQRKVRKEASRVDYERMVLNSYKTIANETTLLREVLARKGNDPRRNFNKECGYPDNLTVNDYIGMYERNEIAHRVVNLFPEDCFSMDPDIYETPDENNFTSFETELGNLFTNLDALGYMHQLDRDSRKGRFGIMLLGFNDGATDYATPVKLNSGLTQPRISVNDAQEPEEFVTNARGATKILFLRVFDESVVRIKKVETNRKSPRYGLPIMYQVTVNDIEGVGGSEIQTDKLTSMDIHWTRVIHCAEDGEVLGRPALKAIYNRLCDLIKLLGGSAEMFWKGAFPGYSFELMPSLGQLDADIDVDADKMRKEFEAYSNGLQRYLALTGVTAKSLAPQVASPAEHITQQLQAIAIAIGIPLRILLGSEEARLASNQDTRTWNKKVARRRTKHVTPKILRPFVDRCIQAGIVTPPNNGIYFIEWPDLNAPSIEDLADVFSKFIDGMAKYMDSGMGAVLHPEDLYSKFMGRTAQEARLMVQKAETTSKKILAMKAQQGTPKPNQNLQNRKKQSRAS